MPKTFFQAQTTVEINLVSGVYLPAHDPVPYHQAIDRDSGRWERKQACDFGMAEEQRRRGQDQPDRADPTVGVESPHRWLSPRPGTLSPGPQLPDSFHSDAPAKSRKCCTPVWAPSPSPRPSLPTVGRHVGQTFPREMTHVLGLPEVKQTFSITKSKCLFSHLKSNTPKAI